MRLTFITITFLFVTFNGYSARVSTDTSFQDVTGTYMLRIPSISNELDMAFEIAIIPLDSIGKKEIEWNVPVSPSRYRDDKERPFKELTEMELEKSLLECIPTSDSVVLKTIKQKKYCRKRGRVDAAMGSYFELNHVGFTKAHKLIIIAFVIRWSNCGMFGMPGDKDYEKCKEDENEKENRRNAFIDKIVKELSFYQIK